MAQTPWFQRATSWSLVAGTVSAVVAAAVGLISGVDSFKSQRVSGLEITLEQRRVIETVQAQVEALAAELKAVRDSLQGLSRVPDASKAALQLDQLQKMVVDLQSRQQKLEQVILANPAKALEIPLLQRDLDGLKSAQQESVLVLRQSVDRVYDLNKWLLGAMAVSIVTLAVSNFLKGRESASEKK